MFLAYMIFLSMQAEKSLDPGLHRGDHLVRALADFEAQKF
jgi:hypothetical protein